MVHITAFDGGASCVNGVARTGVAGSVKLEMALPNSCTITYNSSGVLSGTIAVVADVVF